VDFYQNRKACQERPIRLKLRHEEGIIMHFSRITIDHKQMGGVPCIRGLRIPVSTIVSLVADGMSAEKILNQYPDLEHDDISEALHFASQAVKEKELPLVS
jgi:uncharacterized protein (DUF433 family)